MKSCLITSIIKCEKLLFVLNWLKVVDLEVSKIGSSMTMHSQELVVNVPDSQQPAVHVPELSEDLSQLVEYIFSEASGSLTSQVFSLLLLSFISVAKCCYN